MRFTRARSPADGAVEVQIGKHEGRFPAWWKQVRLEINGLARPAVSVSADGRATDFEAGRQPLVILAEDTGNGISNVVR